jgi:hypothetical protein
VGKAAERLLPGVRQEGGEILKLLLEVPYVLNLFFFICHKDKKAKKTKILDVEIKVR